MGFAKGSTHPTKNLSFVIPGCGLVGESRLGAQARNPYSLQGLWITRCAIAHRGSRKSAPRNDASFCGCDARYLICFGLKSRCTSKKTPRENAMKSFQVTDFNAPLKEVDGPDPQPSGTQVLIKVKAAGVCHSDLHIWEGGYDLGHGRKPLSLKDRGVSLPLTMGHETVGEVLALGPDAKEEIKGDIKVGDVALVYPWIGCGKCEVCLAGDENMCLKPRSLGVYCDGGYADHMTVPHPRYLLNLKGLDPGTAAPYACSLVTTYSALKKVEADFGSPIVIFGAGGLGLMALSLLKAMGGKGAIVVDIDSRKRDAAQKAAALATVDGTAGECLGQPPVKSRGP